MFAAEDLQRGGEGDWGKGDDKRRINCVQLSKAHVQHNRPRDQINESAVNLLVSYHRAAPRVSDVTNDTASTIFCREFLNTTLQNHQSEEPVLQTSGSIRRYLRESKRPSTRPVLEGCGAVLYTVCESVLF